MVSLILVLLLDQPVLNRGGGSLAVGRDLLALDLDGHRLVLLQAAGQVGLLGRRRGGGQAEGGNLALGVLGLDGGDLVGLELLQVELLDKVGCRLLVVVFGDTIYIYMCDQRQKDSPRRETVGTMNVRTCEVIADRVTAANARRGCRREVLSVCMFRHHVPQCMSVLPST